MKGLSTDSDVGYHRLQRRRRSDGPDAPRLRPGAELGPRPVLQTEEAADDLARAAREEHGERASGQDVIKVTERPEYLKASNLL